MILIEKYNLQAADITEKIIDNVRNKKNINKEFPIGDLFGLNPEQVTIKTGVFNMPDAATTNFDWKESFPGNIKILVQYLYLNKSKERLESLINHEVNHIMSYLRSNGESIKKYWNQSPKGIKNRYSPADEGYSYRGIKYFKTSEEINSFYNTFCTLMKGKKFNTLEELRAFLKKNIKDDEELVDYYLKNNQETKKHFIRNFYKDGFLEDNFKKLVKEEINIIKLNILKENKIMTILQVLNEASDFTTGKNVLDSIRNGDAGVSAKKFFSDEVYFNSNSAPTRQLYRSQKEVINNKAIAKLDRIIRDCKNYNIDRTKVIKLILKRSGDITTLIDEFVSLDPYVSYFKNRDKQKAKTQYKNLFDNFVNNKADSLKDRTFEKEVNDRFNEEGRVKSVDKEKKQIYGPDNNGWEVFSPLTFAAAKEYSTTKEGKTRWCTAASSDHYNSYTSENHSPLYIIRNYNKDLAYQVNFENEVRRTIDSHSIINNTIVHFMDKNDNSPEEGDGWENTLDIIPTEVLKSISYKGKSLLDFKDYYTKKKNEENNKISSKVEHIKGWKKESFNIKNTSTFNKFVESIGMSNYSIKEGNLLNRFYNKEKNNMLCQAQLFTKGDDEYLIFYGGEKLENASSDNFDVYNKVFYKYDKGRDKWVLTVNEKGSFPTEISSNIIRARVNTPYKTVHNDIYSVSETTNSKILKFKNTYKELDTSNINNKSDFNIIRFFYKTNEASFSLGKSNKFFDAGELAFILNRYKFYDSKREDISSKIKNILIKEFKQELKAEKSELIKKAIKAKIDPPSLGYNKEFYNKASEHYKNAAKELSDKIKGSIKEQ